MTKVRLLSVARDFSRTPGPRYIKQGSWSGEKFRQLLVRDLKRFERLVIDLDGTSGYGSSFLDEAFGGLIREGILSRDEARARIEIKSAQDPTYLAEALQAIDKARPRADLH